MLQVECPSCRNKCETTPEFAGKLVVCPNCGQNVNVPRDTTAITEQEPLPMPKRERIGAEDRWGGPSIAKGGGAAGVWLRNVAYLILGLTVLSLCIALVVPAQQKVHEAAARTQSINNLKQIVLSCQSFNDANKRLPFNGSDQSPIDAPEVRCKKDAERGNMRSGSWAWQIVPFIESSPFFNEGPNDKWKNTGHAVFMCPGRGRPSFEKDGGPWSDYFYNNYLNDPLQASKPDAPDAKRTLPGITDGASETILAGHGNINTSQYSADANVVGSSNIFRGGTVGTMRSGNDGAANPTGVFLKRDSAEDPGTGSWGGPFPQGALMAMADGTVRMFPYATQNFGAFLTPTGGEQVVLPDT
jgi:Protein of unknown function (DUF1559)